MGRKAKPKLSQQEAEDEVILKYMNGEPMTLEETALALHMYDKAHTKSYKKSKPMTRMGLLKLEKNILDKLRRNAEKMGMTKEEMLESFTDRRRTVAVGSYDDSIDAY